MPRPSEPPINSDQELVRRLAQAANDYRRAMEHAKPIELALRTIGYAYRNASGERGPTYTAGFCNGMLVAMTAAGVALPEPINQALFSLDLLLGYPTGPDATAQIMPLVDEFERLTAEAKQAQTESV